MALRTTSLKFKNNVGELKRPQSSVLPSTIASTRRRNKANDNRYSILIRVILIFLAVSTFFYFSFTSAITWYKGLGFGSTYKVPPQNTEQQSRRWEDVPRQAKKKTPRKELEKKGMLGEWVLTAISQPNHRKEAPRVQDRFEFEFCRLAHVLHSETPSAFAFFRDLLYISGCVGDRFKKKMNWEEAEAYLESQRAEHKVVPPTGFLHHEARCGSTLVTNILASNPRALVYSEPGPVVSAGSGICQDCPQTLRVGLLRLAVGLMGVSPSHDHLFFKLIPENMMQAALFKEAFPQTPYIWIHRDPVEVMVSQLERELPPERNGVPHLERAAKRAEDPAAAAKFDAFPGFEAALRDMTPQCLLPLPAVEAALPPASAPPTREAYCAEYLAATSRAAAAAMAADPLGMPVAYEQEPDLATHVIDFVVPDFFGVRLGEAERRRAAAVAGSYSKGSRGRAGGAFAGDDAGGKRGRAWGRLAAEAEGRARGVYGELVAMEGEKAAALRRRRRGGEGGFRDEQ